MFTKVTKRQASVCSTPLSQAATFALIGSDPREELLIAVRGVMAMVAFDDQGAVTNVLRFGTERHGDEMAVGAEVSSSTWHTVIALEPGCVLLEVKAGPFDPNQPKDLAPWAPEENSASAREYYDRMVELIAQRFF